ncbi:hypothetical protein BGX20_005689 [Mortierella sp. AD010]|nr:hypothetical protein BGX20_005689 [Mortierella sp. AD010]
MNASPYCPNKIVEYIECKTCGPPTLVSYIYVFVSTQSKSSSYRSSFRSVTLESLQRLSNARTWLHQPEKSKDGKADDKKKDGSLNIANLTAVDVKKMEHPFSYVFYLYGYLIQFILAGIQLYWLLGYASLVGIVSMIATYPILTKLYAIIMKFFKGIMKTKDERIDMLNEMPFAILFTEIVWLVVPLFNIAIILTVYTKVLGNEISASKLFTTLALFNVMRQALNILPSHIKGTMQAIVSMKRINKFLLEEDLDKNTVAETTGPAKKNSWIQKVKSKFVKAPQSAVQNEPVAEVESLQERFKLKDLNADFPVGKLSDIVSPTGSGKSALLLAPLGEMERHEGFQCMPRLDHGPSSRKNVGSGITYVVQTAWLQNISIRDNISFGREFDQERHDAVIDGCALVTDFDILEFGDATDIGERGVALSGGQKQRVSLARAPYSHANVLLLDDCLSAVDTHTGKHLSETLTGPLLAGRTVLMVTHQVQLAMNSTDLVVVMDRSEIIGAGTPQDAIRNQWVDYIRLSTPGDGNSSDASTLHNEEHRSKVKKANKKETIAKLTQDEKKQEGVVSWNVYKIQNAWLAIWSNKMVETTGSYAIKAFDYLVPTPVSLSLYTVFVPNDGETCGVITMALFRKSTSETVDIGFYLRVYVLLSNSALIFGSQVDYYIIFGGSAASRYLRRQLLLRITRAKICFFDITPIGRITNRFSPDISTVDDDVSNNLKGLFGSFVTVITSNMPLL